jgi:hypothetical protein
VGKTEELKKPQNPSSLWILCGNTHQLKKKKDHIEIKKKKDWNPPPAENA